MQLPHVNRIVSAKSNAECPAYTLEMLSFSKLCIPLEARPSRIGNAHIGNIAPCCTLIPAEFKEGRRRRRTLNGRRPCGEIYVHNANHTHIVHMHTVRLSHT